MSAAIRVDLRSDTVTRPTQAMRQAMADAEVGDDVFGDDPTVRRLEERAAAIFAREAALFVPSGTMANQCCLGALTRPGDEVIAESEAHLLLNEAAGAARWWGCQIIPLCGRRGLPDASDVEAAIRVRDIHHPRTRVLSLENTHNFAGGAILPLAGVDALTALAREHGLATHLDGARLFNAQAATGVPVARWARDFDLVSTCLSKGLGAPVGSLVIGGAEAVERCRWLRKAMGGGMRQVGVLAAAALLALEEGPGLLAADHRRARALADALSGLPGLRVDPAEVETNLVFVLTRGPADEAERRLAERGVLAVALGPHRLRFSLHRDVDDAGLEAAVRACREIWG